MRSKQQPPPGGGASDRWGTGPRWKPQLTSHTGGQDVDVECTGHSPWGRKVGTPHPSACPRLTDDVTGGVGGSERLLDSKSGCSTGRAHKEHEHPTTPGQGLAAPRAGGAGGSSLRPGALPRVHSLVRQGTRDWSAAPRPRRPCTCWPQAAPWGAHNGPSPCAPQAHSCRRHCFSEGARELPLWAGRGPSSPLRPPFRGTALGTGAKCATATPAPPSFLEGTVLARNLPSRAPACTPTRTAHRGF